MCLGFIVHEVSGRAVYLSPLKLPKFDFQIGKTMTVLPILNEQMSTFWLFNRETGNCINCFKEFRVVVVVQSLSHVWLPPLQNAEWQVFLSFTISRSLFGLMSIESVMPANHLILWYPVLLPWIFPGIRDFSNELAVCIRWPKYWSFSFSISPSNEYSGLISLRIDWCDLLAVQGTLKNLQQHNWKASVFWHSALFMIQLSHPYMTTRKTIALTIWTFVGKGMSLLFDTLSRFLIAFLPRSTHTLILWLQSPSTVVLEPKKIKSVTVSTFPPSVCHEVMGLDAMIFVIWMLSFKLAFSLSPFTLFMKFFSFSSWSSLVSLHFLPLEWSNLHNWGWWYFSQQS